MRLTATLLVCAALLAFAGAARVAPEARLTNVLAVDKPADKPWFCHDLDCPKYKLLDNTTSEAYEVREYAPGVWVSTRVSSYAYVLAVGTGFKRLFDYIQGANERNVTVPMTAPVVTRIEASAGPFCKSNFTVAFFVPFDFQDDPPAPSNPDVFIAKSPKLVTYVGQSGGLKMDDWSIARLATSVYDALEADGLSDKVYSSFYFYAGYDPPFRLTGRHNEVLIVAKPENSTEA